MFLFGLEESLFAYEDFRVFSDQCVIVTSLTSTWVLTVLPFLFLWIRAVMTRRCCD